MPKWLGQDPATGAWIYENADGTTTPVPSELMPGGPEAPFDLGGALGMKGGEQLPGAADAPGPFQTPLSARPAGPPPVDPGLAGAPPPFGGPIGTRSGHAPNAAPPQAEGVIGEQASLAARGGMVAGGRGAAGPTRVTDYFTGDPIKDAARTTAMMDEAQQGVVQTHVDHADARFRLMQEQNAQHLDMLRSRDRAIQQARQEAEADLAQLKDEVQRIKETKVRVEFGTGEKALGILGAAIAGFRGNPQEFLNTIQTTIENRMKENQALLDRDFKAVETGMGLARERRFVAQDYLEQQAKLQMAYLAYFGDKLEEMEAQHTAPRLKAEFKAYRAKLIEQFRMYAQQVTDAQAARREDQRRWGAEYSLRKRTEDRLAAKDKWEREQQEAAANAAAIERATTIDPQVIYDPAQTDANGAPLAIVKFGHTPTAVKLTEDMGEAYEIRRQIGELMRDAQKGAQVHANGDIGKYINSTEGQALRNKAMRIAQKYQRWVTGLAAPDAERKAILDTLGMPENWLQRIMDGPDPMQSWADHADMVTDGMQSALRAKGVGYDLKKSWGPMRPKVESEIMPKSAGKPETPTGLQAPTQNKAFERAAVYETAYEPLVEAVDSGKVLVQDGMKRRPMTRQEFDQIASSGDALYDLAYGGKGAPVGGVFIPEGVRDTLDQRLADFKGAAQAERETVIRTDGGMAPLRPMSRKDAQARTHFRTPGGTQLPRDAEVGTFIETKDGVYEMTPEGWLPEAEAAAKYRPPHPNQDATGTVWMTDEPAGPETLPVPGMRRGNYVFGQDYLWHYEDPVTKRVAREWSQFPPIFVDPNAPPAPPPLDVALDQATTPRYPPQARRGPQR